jgi:hypothetical protein
MSQLENLSLLPLTRGHCRTGILRRRPFLFCRIFGAALLLALTLTAFGQGSGDLPPVNKPKGKSPRPTKPAPAKPKDPTPEAPTHRDPPSIPDIAFNKSMSANLDPSRSGQISAVAYYDEYKLKANDSDLFTIQLETSDPALTVQVFDKSGAGLPIIRDPRSGDFRLDTPGGRFAAGDDEWHVRVLGSFSAGKLSPVSYTLTVKRTGLTDAGYDARLQTIVQLFNATKDVNETEHQLVQLAQDDPSRPGAFEMLGVIYGVHRKEFDKAEQAMEHAISLKGSATFKVTHDLVPGKKLSRKGDNYEFPDPRDAWLKISSGQLSLIEAATGQPVVFSVSGAQIKDLTLTKAGDFSVVTVKAGAQPKPYILCPATRTQAESDLILKLIKAHVLGKA